MAQRVTVEMTDDIDGMEAAETIAFSVDGKSYEIDLSEKHAAALRRDLGRYIEHARRAPRPGRTVRRARDRKHSAAVRDWAKQQGMKLSERGRIPASVLSQYQQTHG